jgi:hypothetical protein
MDDWDAFSMIRRSYRRAFGATLDPGFAQYLLYGEEPEHGAALGFTRAGSGPLFLERYLDAPIEMLASAALVRPVPRDRIVEIGNFAAADAAVVVELWGRTANDLADSSEIAAATLTLPLRRMFARLGVPIHVLAPADPARLGADARTWGSYYELDPQVCIGEIAAGQRAISALLDRRRHRREAA